MPNAREESIMNAVKSTITDPDFKVQLPWLLRTTWDTMFSTNDMRESLKVLGRTALHFAFASTFIEVCGGAAAGCTPGMFGVLENCLLSEGVLFELLKKPSHPDARRRVASKGVGTVRDAVHIFVGGLWLDTQGLGKIAPWVHNTFAPSHTNCDRSLPISARQADKADRGKSHHSSEVCALQRIYAFQLAKKPLKVSRTVEALYFDAATPPATPLCPFSPSLGPQPGGDIDDASESSDELFRSSSIPGGATVADVELAKMSLSPHSEEPRPPTVLQSPISLKRKALSDDEDPFIAVAHVPPRTPLASRNLLAVSLPSSPALPVFSNNSPSTRRSLGPLWFPQELNFLCLRR
ncbi:hypothetical protein MSAN_02464800 [Mycena sanguinolenta]|uniref:Uncharacterized protein n=1 Tax=Mycena sanguinolenta TaxID=230812 RepID=A0A8H7CC49_9AGAR|nr:hypothetical protein MSAN_02464800 [Mycena sanguinolenta]